MFGISPVQLIIVLIIVILLFGTKKLKGMGKDLGGAIKGFKDEFKAGEKQAEVQKVEEKQPDATFSELDKSTSTTSTHQNKSE